jgi:arylsulfatase A-like enzyme
MLSRRRFLGAAASGLAAAAAPRKPNFLIILADDMGYSDAGCYGGEIGTPNLDRLASNGLRFTQAYSTARCGPSRSCLLTGRYAQETACDVMTQGNTPESTRFLPEHLKPLGYRSYHSGKWHIKFTPMAGAAFDRTYTMLDELRFFTQNYHELDGQPLPRPEEGYYSTSAISDHAVRFLKDHARSHAQSPFLLYLAPHAPHFPLQAPADDIRRYDGKFAEGWDTARERKWQRMRRMGLIDCALAPLEAEMWTRWNTPDNELLAKVGQGEISRAVAWSTLTPEQKSFQRLKMAIHAAMITRMDVEIGKVLDQVESMGAMRDTVVIFLSDNGASSEQLIRGDGHDAAAAPGSARTHLGLGPGWSSCSNAPFRLHKSWVHEGGIASPMIVHWPNGIKDRNKLRHDPCHFVDIAPTLVDLAGGSAKEFTGRSLVPAFHKDGAAPRDYLYFNHNNNRAIRVGDSKLIATGQQGPWELYDLKRDRCEQRNLGNQQPAKAERLAAMWRDLDAGFVQRRESAPPTSKPRMARRG